MLPAVGGEEVVVAREGGGGFTLNTAPLAPIHNATPLYEFFPLLPLLTFPSHIPFPLQCLATTPPSTPLAL